MHAVAVFARVAWNAPDALQTRIESPNTHPSLTMNSRRRECTTHNSPPVA